MTHCSGQTCRDGNCEGCKDGKLCCDDPRCSPYCRECELPKHHETGGLYLTVSIGIILAIIIAILLIGYGPRFIAVDEGNPENPLVPNNYVDWQTQPLS